MATITLDWLAFTIKEQTNESAAWIHLYASPDKSVSVAPKNGYRSAYRAETGITVQWNVDREEMGYHVVTPGTAIRHLLEHNELDQKTLIQSVLHTGASITRLDLALDIVGTEVNLDKIYTFLESKNYTGSARSISQIHSLNGGNTIYIGSRTSEKFIRIYNKASEQGLQGEHWIRFELETKGMVARSMAHSLAAFDSVWAGIFRGVTQDMVDVPKSSDWKKITPTDATIGIPKIERTTDRERWIGQQVIPAVVKHFTENRKSVAVLTLLDMLQFLANNDTVEG